jgi:6-phosphogluconolactonase
MAADGWLDHVSMPTAERGAEAAAHAYAKTLREPGGFNLVLLGLGGDGHAASLFTGHDRGVALDAPDAIAVFEAPKPPSQRVAIP